MASSPTSSAASSTDPYAEAWAAVQEAVLASPGALEPGVRRAIARGDDPPALAPLLEKVRRHAFRIVDGDVAGLEADVVVEAVLAAAVAEGDLRRRAALEAIG